MVWTNYGDTTEIGNLDRTLIFHITHYKNLHDLLADGGLHCKNRLLKLGRGHEDISLASVQDRRQSVVVPVEPHGNLHDWVPFYFAPRSPMLGSNRIGNAGSDGQEPIVHLVAHAQAVRDSRLPYAFTDKHAVKDATFYTDFQNLRSINWQVMRSKYWNNTDWAPQRQDFRTAEFLVHNFFPCHLLLGIAVMNKDIQARVQGIVDEAGSNLKVKVRPRWYFQEDD